MLAPPSRDADAFLKEFYRQHGLDPRDTRDLDRKRDLLLEHVRIRGFDYARRTPPLHLLELQLLSEHKYCMPPDPRG